MGLKNYVIRAYMIIYNINLKNLHCFVFKRLCVCSCGGFLHFTDEVPKECKIKNVHPTIRSLLSQFLQYKHIKPINRSEILSSFR